MVLWGSRYACWCLNMVPRKKEIKGVPRSCSMPHLLHCPKPAGLPAQQWAVCPAGNRGHSSPWLSAPQNVHRQPHLPKGCSGHCQGPHTIPASPSHVPQHSCFSSSMVYFLGCPRQVYVDLPSVSPCVWDTHTWSWLLLFLSSPGNVHVLAAKASPSLPNSTTSFPLSQLQTPHPGLKQRKDELLASCFIWCMKVGAPWLSAPSLSSRTQCHLPHHARCPS